MEKIVVNEVLYPFSAHVFVHNDWINKRSKKDFVEVAIPLKGNTSRNVLHLHESLLHGRAEQSQHKATS